MEEETNVKREGNRKKEVETQSVGEGSRKKGRQ